MELKRAPSCEAAPFETHIIGLVRDGVKIEMAAVLR